MENKFFPAIAVLIGTVIGAGFLGIPYVVSKAGFIPGMIILALIAFFMIFIKLYFGEVILRTKGEHQITGYAERYLGKSGKYLMFFAMIFGLYAALTAYLIAEGQSLSYIIFGNSSYSLLFSFIFWVILAGLTSIGLRALKVYEKIGVGLVLILLAIICFVFFPGIRVENLTFIDYHSLFLPIGVILFSFLGFSAMAEVGRILDGQKQKMKKVVIIGMIVPAAVYFLFSLITVGNFGQAVPEIATLALGRGFSVIAVLTMFTAYFTSSIATRDIFRFDFGFSRFKGWVLALSIPLILFLLIYFFKLVSFVSILGIAGVVSGGLTGVLVLLMNKASKKNGNRKPEYSLKISWLIVSVLSALFVLGVILELLV